MLKSHDKHREVVGPYMSRIRSNPIRKVAEPTLTRIRKSWPGSSLPNTKKIHHL